MIDATARTNHGAAENAKSGIVRPLILNLLHEHKNHAIDNVEAAKEDEKHEKKHKPVIIIKHDKDDGDKDNECGNCKPVVSRLRPPLYVFPIPPVITNSNPLNETTEANSNQAK